MTFHIESVHEGKKKCHICDICNSSFMQKSALTRHLLAVHENKRLFDWQLCEAKYKSKSNLNKHVTTVHMENKLKIKCGICDVTFGTKNDMKRHISNIHEGKKPFMCLDCNAGFLRPVLLAEHVASVHKRKPLYR